MNAGKVGFHQKGTIVLDCLHSVIMVVPLPVPGDTQYCRYCGDYKTVRESNDSYTAKCNSGKCRLSKNHGADKESAMVTARKHVQRYTRHRVTVFNGLLSVAEITNTEETLFATAESRSAIAADSQKLLRNLGLGGTAKPDGMG